VPDQTPSRPRLDAEEVARRLAGTPWRLEVTAATPSTNAELAARALTGEAPGLVLVTEHQTAGRGRLDRGWTTPDGAALTGSVLVAPGVPVARLPWLPLLTGLAVVDAVRAATGLQTSLKWPNDVLLDEDGEDRKVAGLLVELVERDGELLAVVGCGINVTTTRGELPVPTATSLALAGAASPRREDVLVSLLEAFAARLDGWRTAQGGGLRAAYRETCSTLGRPVRVLLPHGSDVVGTAVDVDDDGRLLVDTGGEVRALGAGDVVHVRPAG
jgi:BirA family biotin operon repressor/biotin-[acetyl-CoA-carboxylase] ligase